MRGQHRELPSTDVEKTAGDPSLAQDLCALAFEKTDADRAPTLRGVLLTLVLGESIFAVAREGALAVAALVHEVARDSFLLPFADLFTARRA